MPSLQDQLLKAGMVDEKKAKQVAKDKRRHAKQVRRGEAEVDNTAKIAVQQAQADKANKAREHNQAALQRANEKAIGAQIIQLIERHRIGHQKGDIGYQFVDNKKIKKIYVDNIQQRQLERGHIAIVRLGASYELVPSAIAGKIEQRDPTLVVLLNVKTPNATQAEQAEDPYADFKVPDDLMW
ncbi:DUF2058 domain-containing protein [Pseudomonadales bacterium]|jgi:uncharacterized protein YaiL (DUF2058 family)|nr:DUF2058 domain-containing protein [Pseudomonadales bacterium]MDB4090556.1 DUF2058 domain-containing protein [Pseudomonadales bacterium]MDB4362745.1 DUF2058 domain-containing protein [Pseudomonadales bacterium]MDB4452781.1 DUF2058 domain-containing protein [bacterium]MDB4630931.1 DUF2058 domain-containing protein [Pseudomonadales bacterium]